MNEIPKDHFVSNCDLDADEPWFEIIEIGSCNHEPKRLPIPKELALYLNTHWCGSKKMHNTIRENTRREIANTIKAVLGLNED